MKVHKNILGLGVLLTCSYAQAQVKIEKKYIFFDFLKDSLKAHKISAEAPLHLQSFSVNYGILNDYVGNTRIGVVTGIISSQRDTMLALHSLVNGAGNLTLEAEYPFAIKQVNRKNPRDFVGWSIHPRISTIIDDNRPFEAGRLSYDLGLNFTGKITRDLGNLGLQYTLRNALSIGNNSFVRKAFEFTTNKFYYLTGMLKMRTGQSLFSMSVPLIVTSFKGQKAQNLPVYAGYSLLF
jgi:hypothetical protein